MHVAISSPRGLNAGYFQPGMDDFAVAQDNAPTPDRLRSMIGTRMKNWPAGLISLLALAPFGIARAADMPVKVPVAFGYDGWTGFYVGANIGYGWGKASDNSNFVDPALFVPITATLLNSDRPKGAIGGGQVGYNWQVGSHGLLGIEADWQGSGQRANQGFVTGFAFFDPAALGVVRGTVSENFENSIQWFGTVRGRAGFTWDHVLVYGTGGLAYGEVKLAGTVNETVNIPPVINSVVPLDIAKVNTGWTLGAGIEGMLASNWSWKLEYLHLDLGSIAGASPAGIANPPSGTFTAQSRFTDNIVRAGLNFQFR
jgi:outer membrane immunogenic protein